MSEATFTASAVTVEGGEISSIGPAVCFAGLMAISAIDSCLSNMQKSSITENTVISV